jgi:hypothetical protein
LVVRALTLTVMRVVRLHLESCGEFDHGETHEDVIVPVGGCSYAEGCYRW